MDGMPGLGGMAVDSAEFPGMRLTLPFGVENQKEVTRHVEGRKRAGGQAREKGPITSVGPGGVQDFLLGEESREGKDAGDGEHRDHRRPIGLGQGLAQAPRSRRPGDIPNVVAVHRVDHHARRKEQKAFEEGMGENVEHGGGIGLAARAQGEHHQAQLGQGGKGQDALEIGLGAGDGGGEHGGEGAGEFHHAQGMLGRGEKREQARGQEHAGHHHGGGMDEGRNRRRAFHRVRQPARGTGTWPTCPTRPCRCRGCPGSAGCRRKSPRPRYGRGRRRQRASSSRRNRNCPPRCRSPAGPSGRTHRPSGSIRRPSCWRPPPRAWRTRIRSTGRTPRPPAPRRRRSAPGCRKPPGPAW